MQLSVNKLPHQSLYLILRILYARLKHELVMQPRQAG